MPAGRVLANTNAAALNPANRWANTLRAGATTQQAITEAVESGGNPLATRWAGHVGSEMAYAAAQPDQEVRQIFSSFGTSVQLVAHGNLTASARLSTGCMDVS